MIRRRRRTTASIPRNIKKYSNETYGFSQIAKLTNAASGEKFHANATIIPAAQNILGLRKCKNFTLKMCISDLVYHPASELLNDSSLPTMVAYALVYLPEGINIRSLNFAPTPESIFEPNQNVILSGMCCSNYPSVVSSRLARNLNSGDSIVLVLMCNTKIDDTGDSYDFSLMCTLNYAVTF